MIHRLYLPVPLAANTLVTLDERCTRHAVQVLRLRPGASIVLFNGEGGEYPAQLEVARKGEATARVTGFSDRDTESPLDIVLVQGISKGERMDYTIQKAVELGVRRIVPVNTQRSVVNLRGERVDKRHHHWQGVAIGACEQCGRNRLPLVDRPVDLHDWLNGELQGTRLVLSPMGSVSLQGMEVPETPITVLIGPEGGLDPAELRATEAAGYRGLRLGPRVLRTETAALAALAALQARWGDLG